MSGINQVTLLGRLVKDPVLKKTPNGLSVANYTLAVDRTHKSANTPEADFIQCVSWRQSADYIGQYARKGNLVGVVGSIQTRSYDDNTGRKVYITEVVTSEVGLYTPKQNNQQYQQPSQQSAYQQPYQQPVYQQASQPQYQQQMQYQQPVPAYAQPQQDVSIELTKDDLPF